MLQATEQAPTLVVTYLIFADCRLARSQRVSRPSRASYLPLVGVYFGQFEKRKFANATLPANYMAKKDLPEPSLMTHHIIDWGNSGESQLTQIKGYTDTELYR
jgi:hypothetical protein